MGMMPMSWPAPDGQPIVGAAWASPSPATGSMSTHLTMSGGRWPNKGIHYPAPYPRGLPKASTRFDHLVDHMAQRILQRHASDALQKACRESVGAKAHEADRQGPQPSCGGCSPGSLTTFFDSPDFLRR